MRAFVTGINGQDGSYLSEHLLSLGYEVAGLVRRSSVAENQTFRINHILPDIKTYYGDVQDPISLNHAFRDFNPDLIFNLAVQSHVRLSFDMPQFTAQVNAIGALNVFNAVREVCPDARVYQASSSEMFGDSVDPDQFQRESTPMHPSVLTVVLNYLLIARPAIIAKLMTCSFPMAFSLTMNLLGEDLILSLPRSYRVL